MKRERILKILLNAKNRYIHDTHRCDFGMCRYLDAEMTLEAKEFEVENRYRYIQRIIPEFNAEFLGGDSGETYWWERSDSESRIKAFDKLITIYEKDNTVCKTNE